MASVAACQAALFFLPVCICVAHLLTDPHVCSYDTPITNTNSCGTYTPLILVWYYFKAELLLTYM